MLSPRETEEEELISVLNWLINAIAERAPYNAGPFLFYRYRLLLERWKDTSERDDVVDTYIRHHIVMWLRSSRNA